MTRINLTLDDETARRLFKYARGRPQASAARELLGQALMACELAERRRKLARDYADGNAEALSMLEDLEPLSLEVIGEEAD